MKDKEMIDNNSKTYGLALMEWLVNFNKELDEGAKNLTKMFEKMDAQITELKGIKPMRYISEDALRSELEETCELFGIHKSFADAVIEKIEQSRLFFELK